MSSGSSDYGEEDQPTSSTAGEGIESDWMSLFSKKTQHRPKATLYGERSPETGSVGRRQCHYCNAFSENTSSFAGRRSLQFVDSKLGTHYAKNYPTDIVRIYICREHIYGEKTIVPEKVDIPPIKKPIVSTLNSEKARFLRCEQQAKAPVVESRKTVCDYCGDLGVDVCIYSSKQSQETIDQKLGTNFAQNHAQKPRIYICRRHFLATSKATKLFNSKPNVSQYLSKPTLSSLKPDPGLSQGSSSTQEKAQLVSLTMNGEKLNYTVATRLNKKIFTILEPHVDQKPLDPIKLLDLPSLTPEENEKFIHLRNGTNSKSFKLYDKLSLFLKKMVQYRLLADKQDCPKCFEQMSLVRNSADNFFWKCPSECQMLSVTAGSFFEKDVLNIRLMMQLMAFWCLNPGLPRDALAMQFAVTPNKILALEKYIASVTKQWCNKNPDLVREVVNGRMPVKEEDKEEDKEEESELFKTAKRVKLEEPDEPTSETFDVTTLFGNASKDLKEKTVSVKKEAEESTVAAKNAKPVDLIAFYKENKERIQSLYQVKDPFPEVFLHDYIFREYFGHQNLMNRILYEITQIWVLGDRNEVSDDVKPSPSTLANVLMNQGEPQSCPECNRMFANTRVLKRHREDVHRIYRKICGKFIRCEECNEEFYLKSQLNDHMREAHQSTTTNGFEIKKAHVVACPIYSCPYVGASRETLALHAFNAHRDEMKELSKKSTLLCTKNFATRKELEKFYESDEMKYLAFMKKDAKNIGKGVRTGHCVGEYEQIEGRKITTFRGYCTFFLKESTRADGSIKISYCTSHLGHPIKE
ncbi:unnamed protein product, partial [Mesorhabditis belari]|uniref:C2H2-type domain-containing protein n=1 Tax=Mesorhabditis belari TaxID=2138241 RepID=A0AAF3EUY2_9BILA